MSYSCAGATRVPYFSSPVITYGGRPTGNAGADNAKVLQLTHYTAANFKQGAGGTPTRKFNYLKLARLLICAALSIVLLLVLLYSIEHIRSACGCAYLCSACDNPFC
jgi:hypothetical protein